MRLGNLLLLAVLVPSLVLHAQQAPDPCATFCVRLASNEQRPGYTIEKVHGGIETIWVSRNVDMGAGVVHRAEYVHDPYGAPAILLHLTDSGQRTMHAFSVAHIGGRVAIFVGGKLIMAPVITGEVADSKLLIQGAFSEEDAKRFVARLNSALGTG